MSFPFKVVIRCPMFGLQIIDTEAETAEQAARPIAARGNDIVQVQRILPAWPEPKERKKRK